MARSLGATVWGQTGSLDKSDWIRGLGASNVVVGGAAAVTVGVGDWRPTVVFDPLGGEFFGAAVEVLAPGGRLVSFGTSAGSQGSVPLQQLYRKGLTAYGYGGLISSDGELALGITQGLEAVRAGRMMVPIADVVALEDVNEALFRLEQRQVLGKLVLDLRPDAFE